MSARARLLVMAYGGTRFEQSCALAALGIDPSSRAGFETPATAMRGVVVTSRPALRECRP